MASILLRACAEDAQDPSGGTQSESVDTSGMLFHLAWTCKCNLLAEGLTLSDLTCAHP